MKSLIWTENNGHCVIPNNTLGTNQFVITENLKIPEEKPDVEQVNQVLLRPEVEEIKVVGIHDLRCDQISIKVVVKGVLHEKIIYTACRPDQPVHSAEFTVPFYGNVLLGFDLKRKGMCQCLTLPPNLENFLDVVLCVEDVTVDLQTGRKLNEFVTLLVMVTGDIDNLLDNLKN